MKHLHLNPQTGLVLDPHSGARFRVNSTGIFLLRAWQQSHAPTEVVQAFATEFELTLVAAERAILAFLCQCRDAGLPTPAITEPETLTSTEVNPDAA